MTKRTAQPTLTDMKLAVIKYHTHSNDNPDNKVGGRVINEKFLIGLANDACFTSNNGLKWKRNKIYDELGDNEQAQNEENRYDRKRRENWIAKRKTEIKEKKTFIISTDNFYWIIIFIILFDFKKLHLIL